MKVAVYTIALNEAAHVERWATSAIDADYRVVVDTGSTDDTVERLKRAGVTVHSIAVRPWRFDDARNAAMALLPADADVCVSMDMDVFLLPGWRAKLEAAWTAGTTALCCRMELRHNSESRELIHWFPSKSFHARWGYRFRRPVHEALFFCGNEVVLNCFDIVMHHVQEYGKDTRRQYFPLMQIAHDEDPDDSQICFWLGREYMWASQQERGIELMNRYLALPSSTWPDERAEAMRCLARMEPARKMHWLDLARSEAPHRREIWLDLAEEYYVLADWSSLFWACASGIDKTRRNGSYLDDPQCWGPRLYDLGAIACRYLDMTERAMAWGRQAASLSPDDQRLRLNCDAYVAGGAKTFASTRSARMFTSWATVVQVDLASGELLHGPPEGNAGSVVFVCDPVSADAGQHGWLAGQRGEVCEPAVCGTDHTWVQSHAAGNGETTTPTAFRIVPLERGVVGLRSGGRYLCAEPDGRLTLSKQRCSTWEYFLPAEEWASSAGKRSTEPDPSIDWQGLRSFTVPPAVHEQLSDRVVHER